MGFNSGLKGLISSSPYTVHRPDAWWDPLGFEGSDKMQENFVSMEIIPSEVMRFRNKFIHESKVYGWLFCRICGDW
jgi:hypothetical protein